MNKLLFSQRLTRRLGVPPWLFKRPLSLSLGTSLFSIWLQKEINKALTGAYVYIKQNKLSLWRELGWNGKEITRCMYTVLKYSKFGKHEGTNIIFFYPHYNVKISMSLIQIARIRISYTGSWFIWERQSAPHMVQSNSAKWNCADLP